MLSDTRVVVQLITGAAGKADSWRIMATYLPVALYYSWQVDGAIPDANAPRPKSHEKAAAEERRVAALVNERRRANALREGDVKPEDLDHMADETANRNYRTHYDAVLNWCVAMRIWGSRSITVGEVRRANDCHMFACQAWTLMLCHLTPYFHILMHISVLIYFFGPIYAWWVFAYERFNGFLSKIKHNGHAGELECTMMRSWTKLHLVHDLVRVFSGCLRCCSELDVLADTTSTKPRACANSGR